MSPTCVVTDSPAGSPTGGQPGAPARLGGTALLECDDRTVVVRADYGHVLACGERPVVLAVEEAGRVLLSVRPTKFATSPDAMCDASAVTGGTPQVRLKAPLGRRVLVDAATGHPIVRLADRTLQHVTYLPLNYRPAAHEPLRFTTDAAPGRTPPTGSSAVIHLFGVGGDDGNGALLVTQATGTIDTHGASPAGTVTVHGRSARVLTDSAGRYLIWQENGWTLEVWSIGSMSGHPLSTAELQKIAEGMRTT